MCFAAVDTCTSTCQLPASISILRRLLHASWSGGGCEAICLPTSDSIVHVEDQIKNMDYTHDHQVTEHLELYAAIKGYAGADMKRVAASAAANVGALFLRPPTIPLLIDRDQC